jgi:hypothetical protein
VAAHLGRTAGRHAPASRRFRGPITATDDRSAGLLLKRALLLFWAMYFSIVALTNAVDLLGALGAFDWTFLDSGNFDYLRSAVRVYEVGPVLTKCLLAGALAIELIAAVLFWRALLRFGACGIGAVAAFQALCWAVLVWSAFVFMAEFFIAYRSESTFRELLALTIVTGLAVALIPDDAGSLPGPCE